MKLTDGKKTVDIKIQRWNGSGYDPNWSTDYFNAGSLPYDEETDTYMVEDVDYCIETASNANEDGACGMYDENGDLVRDENMFIFIEQLN